VLVYTYGDSKVQDTCMASGIKGPHGLPLVVGHGFPLVAGSSCCPCTSSSLLLLPIFLNVAAYAFARPATSSRLLFSAAIIGGISAVQLLMRTSMRTAHTRIFIDLGEPDRLT